MYEYFEFLLKNACEECAAYNYLNHCGGWDCKLPELYSFIIEYFSGDIEKFLDFIYFYEKIYPEIIFENFNKNNNFENKSR